jgi:hypothetical protein
MPNPTAALRKNYARLANVSRPRQATSIGASASELRRPMLSPCPYGASLALHDYQMSGAILGNISKLEYHIVTNGIEMMVVIY